MELRLKFMEFNSCIFLAMCRYDRLCLGRSFALLIYYHQKAGKVFAQMIPFPIKQQWTSDGITAKSGMRLKMNTKTYYYMCTASFFGYEIVQDDAPTPGKLVICSDGNIMRTDCFSLQLEIKWYFSAFVYKSVSRGYSPCVLYKGKISRLQS